MVQTMITRMTRTRMEMGTRMTLMMSLIQKTLTLMILMIWTMKTWSWMIFRMRTRLSGWKKHWKIFSWIWPES